MSQMLPSRDSDSVRLAEVLTSSLAAVRGESNRLGLPRVESAIVLLVDGLGLSNLRASAGYARSINAAMTKKSDWALATFPSTTATALASLSTGVEPGEHGIVGYSVFDRAAGLIRNQLTGWGPGMEPTDWQRASTVFERTRAAGLRADVIGHRKFAGSGFSSAVLRGAEYVPADEISARLERAVERSVEPGVSYVYVSELDQAAHAHGWKSDRWLALLEEIDTAVRSSVGRLGPRVGMLLTADHGVIDVPAFRHVLIDERAPALRDGVQATAGDPRAMGLWLTDAPAAEARSTAAEDWQHALGDSAWVLSREQALDARLYGSSVHPAVVDRIADVLVIARKQVAFYDGRTATPQSRSMIGQHGAMSDEETRVPLVRFGAFA
ncbi:MAG: alkaline phosphatase family protein [Agromyces sp.]